MTPMNMHVQSRICNESYRVPSNAFRCFKTSPRSNRNHWCLTSVAVEAPSYVWTGEDEFSQLNDRQDKKPLSLPDLKGIKRVVLVRHGQSSWNAEGRIQGSSNLAVLTAKGVLQAQTTRDMLSGDKFNILFHSPLARASQTAEVIWENKEGDIKVLPSLREVDLYSFQGLLKAEGKSRYGDVFKTWQKEAANFEIDNHAPVRELWYRASLAWQDILGTDMDCTCALVVAHNAVNQALICTALGLPPTYFRRFLQSNAATSVLDFSPTLSGEIKVSLDRLNQSPGLPYQPDGAGRPTRGRLVLIRAPSAAGCEEGLVLGRTDQDLTPLGRLQATKTAEFLMDMRVHKVVCSPLQRAHASAVTIAELQALTGRSDPAVEVDPHLVNAHMGSWQGQELRQVRGDAWPEDAEPLSDVWERVKGSWQQLLSDLQEADGEEGRSIVVVGHALVLSALLGQALGIGTEAMSMFRFDTGGVSILDFPDGPAGGPCVVRCLNYTAHLGRWAVPVTRDDLDEVCGIDGCF